MHDEHQCHQIMQRYYGLKHDGKQYFLCPDCKIAVNSPYELFYEQHHNHLSQFTVNKKTMFQSIMSQKQQLQPVVNPASHEKMDKYYSLKFNGKLCYICPTCKTGGAVEFSDFLEHHGHHLTKFQEREKKDILISHLNAQSNVHASASNPKASTSYQSNKRRIQTDSSSTRTKSSACFNSSRDRTDGSAGACFWVGLFMMCVRRSCRRPVLH